ncbi:MAG TPA: TolC family protein [Planctomycetota bacterium]|nr:TolC family protein [Planctomycetota bacterium]
MSRQGTLLHRLLLTVSAATACTMVTGCALARLPSRDSLLLEPPLPDLRIGWAQPAAGPGVDAAPTLPRPTPSPGGRLELDVAQAILTALENNQALKVECLNPDITRTFEGEERAIFDPVVGAETSTGVTRSRSRGADGRLHSATSGRTSLDAWVRQFLPTGTTVELDGSYSLTGVGTWYHDKLETARIGVSVTQALLRGCGVAVNLATLRQARLDTLASHYEFRGFAESLVADVEHAYWDCALAERQIEIYAASLKVAEDQLAETMERIKIGKLAETELAAVQAEVASRREALINARSALATARLRFLRLLNPPGANPWGRDIALLVQPAAPDVKLDDVEAHVQLALRLRPDINEAKLRVRRGDLEIVKTRNGLLPKLDLFATLGKSGYSTALGHSPSQLPDTGYDALVGLTYQFPIGNRAAGARHERAVLTSRQLTEALDSLAQLAQLDVRTAYIEVERAREQVTATAATRKAREVASATESARLREGKSTPFLVALAQRDLLASQIAEVEAVVNLLKNIVTLYRGDGSLLERRGIAAPGRGLPGPATSPAPAPATRNGPP